MTRPRSARRRHPVLVTVLVTACTIGAGSGAGLLLAHTLDRGTATELADPPQLATTGPTAPGTTGSTAIPVIVATTTRTAAPAVTSTRPTTSPSRASRSSPSRSPRTSATSKPPVTRTAASSKAPTGVPAMEAAVLTITNSERSKAGCKPLTANSQLTLAARRHSQYMSDTNKHAHEGIGDGTPQTRIDAAGYRWRGWGENIAWGYTSAAAVMKGWMSSAGHKANILNCSFTEIGIGVDRGGTNWTQDFGTPG